MHAHDFARETFAAGPARMARLTAVPFAGKWKSESSASTLGSARSTVMRCERGSPFRPDSIENGTMTPATAS